MDVASSKWYLVDSGSSFGILPHKPSAEPAGPCLMTADGKPINCWGHRTCTVRIWTREFAWTFLLAPVAFPILGADFLINFNLLVNVSNKRLVACGGKLIQLEQGRRSKAAVVAAAPLLVVDLSSPTLPTVEAPPCSDYWWLNLVTKRDVYLPPYKEDLSAWLAGKKVFSKLDLRKGYYQVLVAQQDITKMVDITPFWLFEFLWMSFGLRNARQSFQRFMDYVLEWLDYLFVDLVASNTKEEYHL